MSVPFTTWKIYNQRAFSIAVGNISVKSFIK